MYELYDKKSFTREQIEEIVKLSGDTLKRSAQPGIINAGWCIVSVSVLEGQPVYMCARHNMPLEYSSGWIFTSTADDDEHIKDDMSNFRVCDYNVLCELFPNAVYIYELPYGAELFIHEGRFLDVIEEEDITAGGTFCHSEEEMSISARNMQDDSDTWGVKGAKYHYFFYVTKDGASTDAMAFCVKDGVPRRLDETVENEAEMYGICRDERLIVMDIVARGRGKTPALVCQRTNNDLHASIEEYPLQKWMEDYNEAVLSMSEAELEAYLLEKIREDIR